MKIMSPDIWDMFVQVMDIGCPHEPPLMKCPHEDFPPFPPIQIYMISTQIYENTLGPRCPQSHSIWNVWVYSFDVRFWNWFWLSPRCRSQVSEPESYIFTLQMASYPCVRSGQKFTFEGPIFLGGQLGPGAWLSGARLSGAQLFVYIFIYVYCTAQCTLDNNLQHKQWNATTHL